MSVNTLTEPIHADVLSDDQTFELDGDNGDEALMLTLPANKRTIRTKSADPEIDSLYGKWKKGKLILQPDFQRQFVWDRQKASKLIESVLMAVPLPIVYLAQEVDRKEAVIDGQQRLTSFFSYIDGQFPSGEPFRLGGMKVFPELERKLFAELDETTQDKIRYYEIRTITILSDSDPDLKFEIFERLNTGSVPLNDMELRNCVYMGRYMDVLKELADDPEFRSLLGFKNRDKRMRDVELVLRFSAFYHASYLNYQSPMKTFFNKDMEKYRYLTKADEDDLRKAFRNALHIVKSLFAHSAFKRFHVGAAGEHNGSWEDKKFNASLFDVMMGVFARRDKSALYPVLDAVREAFIDLMLSDQDFIEAILFGTSEVSKVVTRFDKARLLVDDLLKNHKPQPRCFSLQLKKDLFTNDPVCAICHQQIQLMDDAAVDHIVQYWKGGQTIPENARLTHRYCNMARPRHDQAFIAPS